MCRICLSYLFSEFGRRVKDNGSGTDHGSAGVSFVVGPRVKGGMYGEYPDTDAGSLDQGDLVPNQDFRGVYSTIVQEWLGLDPVPIVNGQFEQPQFVEKVAGSWAMSTWPTGETAASRSTTLTAAS